MDFDIVENVAERSGATTAPGSKGATTSYTTTLTGQGVEGSFATERWSQSMTQSGTMHAGPGGGAGKPNFSDVTARTQTGYGTVTFLSSLFGGSLIPTVELTGCETTVCTQKATLSRVLVSELVIGDPDLYDTVSFNYGTIG